MPMLSKDFGRRAVRRNQLIASLLRREQYVRQTVEKTSEETPGKRRENVGGNAGKTSGEIIELILQNARHCPAF